MAVKRCPYCKAIIDEGAEYCTNCGTKLLFPEDEAVVEEIPGDMLKHSDFPDEEEDEEKEEEADKKKRVSESQEEAEVAEIEEDKEEIDSPPAPPKKSKSKRGRSLSKTKKVEPVEIVDDEKAKEEDAELAIEEVPPDVVVDEAAEDIEPEPEDLEEVIDVQEEVKMETRRGRTEDLPEGFAETLEAAKARAEADEQSEEIEEPKAEEAVEEIPKEVTEDEIIDVVDSEVSGDQEVPMDEAGEVYEETVEPPLGEKVEDSGPEEQLREPSRYEEATVQTNDIEEIVDEAEIEKKEIEHFIESVKKERGTDLQIDETGELPPWAEAMEGTTPPPIPPTDEIELREEEVSEEIEEVIEDVERWEAENVPQPDDEPEEDPEPLKEQVPGQAPGFDTESAFPETVAVDQKGLPFRGDTQEEPVKDIAPQETPYQTTSYKDEPYKDEPILEESIDDEVEEAAVSTEAPRSFRIRPRRRTTPIPFIDWIKARIFDVFFIAALWFITLWVASQVLEIAVFQLMMTSFTLTLIFLGILLALYFFFFLFFLGETLGNYLFSQEE